VRPVYKCANCNVPMYEPGREPMVGATRECVECGESNEIQRDGVTRLIPSRLVSAEPGAFRPDYVAPLTEVEGARALCDLLHRSIPKERPMPLKSVVDWLDAEVGWTVEDWGGDGSAGEFVKMGKYVKVGERADLLAYRNSGPESILLKDQLGTPSWEYILNNALCSFVKRLAVVVHPEVRGQGDVMAVSRVLVPKIEPFGNGSLCYKFERRRS